MAAWWVHSIQMTISRPWTRLVIGQPERVCRHAVQEESAARHRSIIDRRAVTTDDRKQDRRDSALSHTIPRTRGPPPAPRSPRPPAKSTPAGPSRCTKRLASLSPTQAVDNLACTISSLSYAIRGERANREALASFADYRDTEFVAYKSVPRLRRDQFDLTSLHPRN